MPTNCQNRVLQPWLRCRPPACPRYRQVAGSSIIALRYRSSSRSGDYETTLSTSSTPITRSSLLSRRRMQRNCSTVRPSDDRPCNGRHSSAIASHRAENPIALGCLMSADHASVTVLSEDECWSLLLSMSLGRLVTIIAVPEPQGRERTVDHRGARSCEGGLRR